MKQPFHPHFILVINNVSLTFSTPPIEGEIKKNQDQWDTLIGTRFLKSCFI
jgi:hypothetical protein